MSGRFEEDDFADEEFVKVIQVRDRAVALPKSASRVSADAVDLLGEMQEIAVEIAQRETRLEELTVLGRQMGVSWSLLGWVQGLTGEAVRRRQSES